MSSAESLFCPLASSQVEIDTDGSVRPCCNFEGSFGNIKELGRGEVFHSQAAQELRKNLRDGKKDPRCDFCWRLENKKITSKRQQSLTIYKHYHIDSNQNAENSDQFILKSLDLKQSNLCNLKCRTCSPFSSSKWVEEYLDHHFRKFGNRDIQFDPQFKNSQIRWFNDSFWLNQSADFLNLEKIDFYGGEPLLDPYHIPFLKYLIEIGVSQNISLVYGSNGSLLLEDFFKIWNQFKRVKFQISQDGVGKAFEYLRYPAKWPRQIEVIEKLKAQNKIQFGVTLTYSSLNLMHLPESFLWLHENQIDFVINPVIHPAKFNAGHLPEGLKKTVMAYYNQVAIMHSWMKPYLNEVISFIRQTEPDPFFFKELQLAIQHGDQWRKQTIKDALPHTFELFEGVLLESRTM